MTQPTNPESSESQSTNAEMQEVEADIEAQANEATQDEGSLNESDATPSEGQDELSKAKNEIENLNQELLATQDKYLRLLADFENFKKRAQKERSDLLKYQGERIIVDLIRVIDDLDLAMQFNEGQNSESNPEMFRQGIELIYKSFCDVLKKWEIRSESAIGQVFDPVKHLAISKVFVEEATPGTVISELKKVFFYKDKMIRVGEVVVASEQSPE